MNTIIDPKIKMIPKNLSAEVSDNYAFKFALIDRFIHLRKNGNSPIIIPTKNAFCN